MERLPELTAGIDSAGVRTGVNVLWVTGWIVYSVRGRRDETHTC